MLFSVWLVWNISRPLRHMLSKWTMHEQASTHSSASTHSNYMPGFDGQLWSWKDV